MSGRSGMPPLRRSARPSKGPASARSQARRSSTAASWAPKRRTRPKALVDRHVRAVPERPVLDHEDGHRPRHQPGHRAHRPVAVAGLEAHAARRPEPLRVLVRRRPALVPERAHDGAPERGAHRRPRDRRPRVEDEAVAETERLFGRDAVDENRIGGHQARERLPIRGRDARRGRGHGRHDPARPSCDVNLEIAERGGPGVSAAGPTERAGPRLAGRGPAPGTVLRLVLEGQLQSFQGDLELGALGHALQLDHHALVVLRAVTPAPFTAVPPTDAAR